MRILPICATVADIADEYLPAVAAVPYKPVDPRDPHFMERMEEGGRVLARQAAERQAHERRPAQARVVPTEAVRQESAFPEAQRLPQPSRLSKAGNSPVDPTKRKPSGSVRAQTKNVEAPKERKISAPSASAG